jgi:hypothetical protein
MAKDLAGDMNIETILANPNDSKILMGFIEEYMLCSRKIKNENEAKRDIRNECKDKLGIKPSAFNKYAKAFDDVASAEKSEAEWEEAIAVVKSLQG